MSPPTAPLGPVSRTDVVVSESGSSARSNVALTAASTRTLLAPEAGEAVVSPGAAGSGRATLNVQVDPDTGAPSPPRTPLPIFAVYVAPGESAAVGASVAMSVVAS